jgi:hypothetical protein
LKYAHDDYIKKYGEDKQRFDMYDRYLRMHDLHATLSNFQIGVKEFGLATERNINKDGIIRKVKRSLAEARKLIDTGGTEII